MLRPHSFVHKDKHDIHEKQKKILTVQLLGGLPYMHKKINDQITKNSL